MTLEELTQQLTDALGAKGKELAAKYGPTILAMTTNDLDAWLNYVFVGQYSEAYALYLKTKDPTGILAEWDKEHAAWVADNEANAEKIEMANKIGLEFAKAMLTVILAVVGF